MYDLRLTGVVAVSVTVLDCSEMGNCIKVKRRQKSMDLGHTCTLCINKSILIIMWYYDKNNSDFKQSTWQ